MVGDTLNEINFFDSKKRSGNSIKEASNYTKYGIIAAIAVLLLVLIIINIGLNKQISSLNAEVNDLTVQRQNLMAQFEQQNNADAEEVVAGTTVKEQTINEIEALDSLHNISSETIVQIQNSIPSNLFLSTLELHGPDLIITGYSKESNSVAQFQYNLNETDTIFDAFVPTIDNQIGSYEFTINAKIRS